MKPKTIITYGFALFFLIGIVYLFYPVFNNLSAPLTVSESFSTALWSTWGISIVIIAFIIFAGGTGILVLLGGGWRWE
jgi:hypothetical protein